jgi:hypothetical protein
MFCTSSNPYFPKNLGLFNISNALVHNKPDFREVSEAVRWCEILGRSLLFVARLIIHRAHLKYIPQRQSHFLSF